MGCGIAHICAASNLSVSLVDISDEILARGMAKIEKNLARQVKKDILTQAQATAAIANISTSTDYKKFEEADLVIEAATEKEELKNAIIANLCPHLSKQAIIASNTSSISITRLASQTDRPDQFVGIHFMNPVPLMKLVELIQGIATSDETFRRAKAFTREIGKSPIVSADFPAFIVNRVLLPMINEAIYTIHEGVGTLKVLIPLLNLGPITLWDRCNLLILLASIPVLLL